MSPFGMAIILPALPSIVDGFDTDYASAQFLVSVYLIGLGLSQLVSGFLCDRFGRRPVVLTGFAVFVAASIACVFADSVAELVPLRFLQAAGVSTGTVAGRAIVRDLYSAERGARAMSYITIGLGTAPVIAPMLGGWLAAGGGWTAIFWATAILGAVLFVLLFLQLPETRSAADVRPAGSAWAAGYAELLCSRPFLGFTLVYGFVQGSFFSFLAVGAGVFENDFGLGSGVFGVVWGSMAIAYVLGATIGGRLSTSSVSGHLLPAAVIATAALGVIQYLLVTRMGVMPVTVLIPLGGMMTLSGVVTPLVLAGVVYHHGHIAGTSAGLSSAMGLVIGSSFTVASGYLYAGSFVPIAGLILVATAMTAVSWLLVRKVGLSPDGAVQR